MILLISRQSHRPKITTLKSTRRPWLSLTVVGATVLFLARLCRVQVLSIRQRRENVDLRMANLLTLLPLVLLLLLVFQLLRTDFNFVYAIRLDNSSEFGRGEVIEKWVEHSSNKQTKFFSFRYLQDLEAKARVQGFKYRRVHKGDGLLIGYLPDRPTVTRINLEILRSKPEQSCQDRAPLRKPAPHSDPNA